MAFNYILLRHFKDHYSDCKVIIVDVIYERMWQKWKTGEHLTAISFSGLFSQDSS